MTYDSAGIGTAVLALYDQTDVNLGMPLLQGRFMAMLVVEIGTQIQPSLSQIGDVPAGTRSLRFLSDGHRGPPDAFVNGSPLPLVRLSGGTDPFTIASFGADISSYAGSTVELRFNSGLRITSVDDVAFSPLPVPEPNSLMLPIITICAMTTLRQGEHPALTPSPSRR